MSQCRQTTSWRVASLALIAALTLCSASPVLAAPRGHSGACSNAGASVKGTPAPVLRAAIVCLVNQQRARYHLPGLVPARRLTTAAQRYTNAMVRQHFFSHTAPNGSTPGARIAAAGFRWSWYGENIASGFPTPRSVVNGWMHSQGHCYNILAPTVSDIGVGVSPRPTGVAVTPATWTLDFGLPLGQQAASGNWGPANSCPH